MPMPEMTKDAEGWDVYAEESCREHFETKEWKEYCGKSDAIIAEDKVRRERTKAIKSGANIDLRTNPLPGDPKID
jgi:hypothetical protein